MHVFLLVENLFDNVLWTGLPVLDSLIENCVSSENLNELIPDLLACAPIVAEQLAQIAPFRILSNCSSSSIHK
jgi:hypothetical protein